jgi:hypothetical protein
MGECLNNINNLIENAKRILKKSFKSKYLNIIKDLKIIKYNNKVAKLKSVKVKIL